MKRSERWQNEHESIRLCYQWNFKFPVTCRASSIWMNIIVLAVVKRKFPKQDWVDASARPRTCSRPKSLLLFWFPTKKKIMSFSISQRWASPQVATSAATWCGATAADAAGTAWASRRWCRRCARRGKAPSTPPTASCGDTSRPSALMRR